MKPFRLLLFLLILIGCNENYYENYAVEDLWRLPLIKPYELRNTMGAKRNQDANDNWHLVFKHKKDTAHLQDGTIHEFYLGVNVTMVNVDNNIIYGYGNSNPSQPFIINTKTGEEITFDNINEWKRELNKLNIDFNKVYDVFDLFDDFKDHKKLKWKTVSTKIE